MLVTGSRDWRNLAAIQHDLHYVFMFIEVVWGNARERMVVVQGGNGEWKEIPKRYTKSNVPNRREHMKYPVRGADAMACYVATYLGDAREGVIEENNITVEADWDTYRRAAGPRRNTEMVGMGPNLVFAYHEDLRASKGTKDCVTKALKTDAEVILCTLNERINLSRRVREHRGK